MVISVGPPLGSPDSWVANVGANRGRMGGDGCHSGGGRQVGAQG